MESRKHTILIAEDEDINRSILCEMLKDKYEILEAEDGREAISLIGEHPDISLILLDIHMPGVDGYGVMDHLAEHDLSDRIPVIITTGDQSKDVVFSGKRNRVTDIVYKPFRAADIRRRVDNLVETSDYERHLEEKKAESLTLVRKTYMDLRKERGFAFTGNYRGYQELMKRLLPDRQTRNDHIRGYTKILVKAFMKEHPEYGLKRADALAIRRMCVLQDIGFVAVPYEQISREEGANGKSFVRIRKRPQIAGDIVTEFLENEKEPEKKTAIDICTYLEERFDGKGYPKGLEGNDIPIAAQLVGIAKRYEDVRFPLHGGQVVHEGAMNRIISFEHRYFNPDVLQTFENVTKEIEAVSEQ